TIIPVCTKYIDKFSSIQVSSAYQPAKTHYTQALIDYRLGCQEILNAFEKNDILGSIGKLDVAKNYFAESADEMTMATALMPK
ncbi:MAG: hypothetical protein NTV68_15035, partial [Methanomicrobiales archaeon]|nr:hypothetical protein [Methanomicrobiales archaeon]